MRVFFSLFITLIPSRPIFSCCLHFQFQPPPPRVFPFTFSISLVFFFSFFSLSFFAFLSYFNFSLLLELLLSPITRTPLLFYTRFTFTSFPSLRPLSPTPLPCSPTPTATPPTAVSDQRVSRVFTVAISIDPSAPLSTWFLRLPFTCRRKAPSQSTHTSLPPPPPAVPPETQLSP